MRTGAERTVLRAAGLGAICCLLPWYGDPTVWGFETFGLLGAAFGGVGWWLALNYRSPVLIAFACAAGGFFALLGLAEPVLTPFPVAALVAFGVAVVGAVRVAPGR